jgi:hypothetical protein
MAMIWLSVKREFFIEFPFKSNNLEILLLTHIKGWGDYQFSHGSIDKKFPFFGGLAPEFPAAGVDSTTADATMDRCMNSRRETS